MGRRVGPYARALGFKSKPGMNPDEVISRAVEVFDTYADKLSENYRAGIKDFASDSERIQEAKEKLAYWYLSLGEVSPDIAKAMAKAKAKYAEYKRILKQRKKKITVAAPAPIPVPAA